MKKRPAGFLCLLWFMAVGDFSGAGFRSAQALILTSGNMPRGLPRETARREIQGGMPPWSQGAGSCPAREREAGSKATVGRGKREAGSPSKLTGRVRELALENPDADTLYFARPVAIGHDDENLYVLDSIDSAIRVFSKSGAFRFAIGKKGQGPAEFDGPNDFSLYGGKIYVSDAGNRRIQILDIKGKYLGGFKVTSFPMKVLALDEKAVVVSHLPAALPGDAAKEENLVRCFTPDGDYVWEAVRSLSNGDPVFDTMQNRHVLKACSGGFYFLRKCNDPWIRRLDKRGNISGTIRVDKKFGWKMLSIPAQKGKKLTLSGLFWDCAVSGGFLYLLVPEFSESGDLVAGRRLAVLSDDGSMVGWLDLPVRVNKISIDGGRVYVIDTNYRLRIFLAEGK